MTNFYELSIFSIMMIKIYDDKDSGLRSRTQASALHLLVAAHNLE